MIKKIILLVYIIGVLHVFSANFLPEGASYYFILISEIAPLCVFLWISFIPSSQRWNYPLNNALYFLIFTFFISIVSSYLINDQSPTSSIFNMLEFFVFLLIPILQRFQFKRNDVEIILIILFVLVMSIFIIDLALYPNPPFALRFGERRGGIGFLFYGHGFLLLGGLYFLNRYIINRRFIYLLVFFTTLLAIVYFTQSRSMTAGLIIGAFYVLFKSKIINLKWINYAIFFVSVVLVMFIINYSNSFFFNMFEETKTQIEYRNTDLRVLSAEYFLSKYSKNSATLFMGNGLPGNSSYGRETQNAYIKYQFSPSDIGLIGYWIYFGIFGIIAWVVIFYKVFKIGSNKENLYLKGYFVFLLLSILSSYSIFDPGFMPATAISLFLLNDSNKSIKFGI